MSDVAPLIRQDIAKMLLERFNLEHKEAHEVVNAVFDEISLALAQGRACQFRGLGSFKVSRIKRKHLFRPWNLPNKAGKAQTPLPEIRFKISFKPSSHLSDFLHSPQLNPAARADYSGAWPMPAPLPPDPGLSPQSTSEP